MSGEQGFVDFRIPYCEIIGGIEMDNRAEPIVVEQTYGVSKDELWRAITDPEQMPKWFFEQINDFRPEVGFQTEFNVHVEGKDYLHQWKILEVVPGKKIVYDWRYKDIPGIGKVTWEVSGSSDGSHLKLMSEGLETFPDDDPSFTREAGVGGWNYFICDSLKEYLERS